MGAARGLGKKEKGEQIHRVWMFEDIPQMASLSPVSLERRQREWERKDDPGESRLVRRQEVPGSDGVLFFLHHCIVNKKCVCRRDGLSR